MSVAKVYNEVLLTSKYQELRDLQQIENEVALEIGRILYEVRTSDISGGKWTEWIESVGYNARTARRYIQVYEQFRDIPTAKEVSFSKLVELLPLPVDVDRSEFLNEVKDQSVRKIREKVKDVNGADSKQTVPREKVVKPPRESVGTKIGKSVSSLMNLIPFYTEMFESGEIDVGTAIEIGGFSKETQELMCEYESENSRLIETRGIIALLVDANFSHEDIRKCVRLIDCVAFDYSKYRSVDETLQEMYETLNMKAGKDDIRALFDTLIKFEERVIELDKEYAARGTNIDEVYAEKLFGKQSWSGRNGSSSKGNSQSFSSHRPQVTDVKQILGVGDDANADVMKKQYRHLMKVLHPDVGGSPYLFGIVKDAYDSYAEGKTA